MCVCVCVLKRHDFLAEGVKLGGSVAVISNTAPKCCVPPQSLSEGLFKKPALTAGLLCALFLIYSPLQSEGRAAQHDLQETGADSRAVLTAAINTAEHNSHRRTGQH